MLVARTERRRFRSTCKRRGSPTPDSNQDAHGPTRLSDLARARAEYELIATEHMQTYPEYAPADLPYQLMQAANCEHGAEVQMEVAAVLRGRQAEWLKSRRWSSEPAADEGELTRSSDGARPPPMNGL